MKTSDHQSTAFTLIELLVVIAVFGVLGLLVLPALAGTRTDSRRTQCQSNLKQLQVGFQLFAQDHDDMYPPAGLSIGSASSSSLQITWDSWINKYIGGTLSDSDMATGVVFPAQSNQGLSLEVCPADTFPKASWIGGNNPWFALRSYAMDSVGPNWSTDYRVDDQSRTYPLPDLTKPGRQGVGIYWTDFGSTPDFNARGYKSSVVRDPAGSILLCENTHVQQVAGNIWTCICLAPNGANSDLYQIDTTTNPNSPASAANQGALLYQAQQGSFNYAFHDGHVQALRVEQTIGTGTLTVPKGMWTVAPRD